MKVDKMKKEDLELMSYNDIANLILEEDTKKTTAELFKKICDLLGLGQKTYENKIGSFYTSLTKDKRFLLLEDGLWDLKKNHSVKVLKIDEVLEDMEELEEITLPKNLKKLERNIFYGCNKLTKIFYSGSKEQWDALPKDPLWNLSLSEDVEIIYLK